MKKFTQKQLKKMVSNGIAKDVTRYSFEQAQQFRKEKTLEKIGYSQGANGLNGALLQDAKTGELFAITAGNTTLDQLF